MDIRQMMDAGLMQSQIELNKAQANKLNTEANKTATVDTEQVRETIANIAQSTNNERLKGILLGYDGQLKEIETNVANMTQEALIRATNANYEKMMQEAIQEMLKTGIDEAKQKDKIEQIKQATQLNYIEMEAKRAGIQLTQEQINKIREDSDSASPAGDE